MPANPMTPEEFCDWAVRQPEGTRYELIDGVPVAMAPETSLHARVKLHAARALEDAMEAEGASCVVYPDGMTVRIDDSHAREPDAAVHCGDALDDDDVLLASPVIVVVIVSPTSGLRDQSDKLIDYARVPSVRHYLIGLPAKGVVIHHRRESEAADFATSIVSCGDLKLDPPGITVAAEAFFKPRG